MEKQFTIVTSEQHGIIQKYKDMIFRLRESQYKTNPRSVDWKNLQHEIDAHQDLLDSIVSKLPITLVISEVPKFLHLKTNK